ncbi:hypothetical protein FANTH_8321 [Fusarium anthophilum]|uniref:Uncharacterized protein n=1 Tax=Fusarium anthophilum TaxID=48485 RepID=A0A8H4ZAW4_9HYPO|nr:hypothetical protein FANTH_8321 [Fusarium anthophilum]
MAAPRRSKRIQALNQSNESSIRVDQSPEAPQKRHREKRRKMAEGNSPEQAPQEQPPKRQAPGIHPKWIEQEEQKDEEHRRKLTRSRAFLHWHLALIRTDFNAIDCWKSLSGSIAALLNVPSIHNASWDSFDEALQRKFISYAPNAEELFEPYGMNQRIFQRWVWEIVDENFFSHKSKDIVWASPYWEAQATMERYLRDHDFPYDDNLESHKFPHWRYTTMDFYMSLKDTPQNVRRIDPTCVVPIIAKALGRYFPEEYDERDPPNETRPVLRNLANTVADLDFLFDANLTVFSHVFHHPTTQQTCGSPFQRKLEGIEGQAMKDHHGGLGRNEEGQNVDLVVNPMLLQRGHYYGYDYEVKTAVHPMEVCVAWLEAHRNLQNSPEEDEEGGQGGETDDATATAEEKSEGHDEDGNGEGKEVKGLANEGEGSREEMDKDEDDKNEDDEAITEEGGKNNKTKERGDEEVDEREEEGDLTKQEEEKRNTKNTTKSKRKNRKKNKNKGKHR